MISAIVVAAGRGVRMNSAVAKQYMELGGRPVLYHSLAVLDRCEEIGEIVWVAPADRHPCETRLTELMRALRTPVRRIAGGASRQESVFLGLQAITPQPAGHWVLVHDAVRPLVTVDPIDRCIRSAKKYGACVLGIPAFDTLKRVGPEGLIEATVPRSDVWLTQTPQVFRHDWLAQAHQAARSSGLSGTDDASLLEKQGFPVRMIAGSRTNIKITTREDFDLANAIWQAREDRVPEPIR